MTNKNETCNRVGVERGVMCEWSKEFPKEVGLYWFYGYRYGKDCKAIGRISGSKEPEPELMIAKVVKISNGLMIIANGQFMYENEVEQPHFKKFVPPNLPDLGI